MKSTSRLAKQMGSKLKSVRTNRKLSLGSVCLRIPGGMPRTSLLNLEEKGPTIQAIRLLILMEYYNIDIKQLLNGNTKHSTIINRRLSKIDFDSDMLSLCEEIYSLKPKTRRGMIKFLKKFIEDMKKNDYLG